MALNPALKAMLESSGLDSNLEDVPQRFEETESLVGLAEPFASFRTEDLIEAAGEAPLCRTDLEKYWHVRQYFVKKEKAATQGKIVAEKLDGIKAVVKHGNKDEIMNLFKQRHVWRQKAEEYCTGGNRICKSEQCPNLALKGSEFCVQHILQDPNQKLYIECATCHRPYPVMSKCFACRGAE